MDAQQNRCLKCRVLVPADAPRGMCTECLTAATTATPTEAGPPPEQRPAPPPLEAIQAAFPQLEVIGFIGQGGMGVVYKARQPKLDRLVAIKILRQPLAADAAFAERFNREARVLARLNHPQIVTVYDYGQTGGFYYLLMEFVDGVNLRQAMRAGRLGAQQALSVVLSICEALQFAHDEGIVHRDVKPENILLDPRGRVKIADFGLARLVGESRQNLTITASGSAMGTPQYMAPEQFEHPHDVDQRADIYSLGVVFYEMLTGELPIGRFALPSQKSAVDPRVDEVVLHALEKEREKRYRSARELKSSIEAIAAQIPADIAAGATRVLPAQSGVSSVPSFVAGTTGDRPKRPFWWTVSAWLFVGIGLFALLDTLASLYARPMNPALSPGLAHLFAGIALLTLSRRWRIVALVALAMAAAAGMLVAIMMAVAPEHAVVTIPGSDFRIPVVERPRWAAAAAIVVAVLFVWPACTLLSRKARALFNQTAASLHS